MAEIAIQGLASIGFQLLKSWLDPTKIDGPVANTLDKPSSQYGDGINRVWGKSRVTGTLIWATNKIDNPYVSGGKGTQTTNHVYTASFAYLLGEGELELQVIYLNNKVWYSIADDVSADQLRLNALRLPYFTFYKGTETQMPDSAIQADLGINRTTAYRGRSYIVFKNFPLADYGNAFPLPSFQVSSASSFAQTTEQRKGLVEGQTYGVTIAAYDNTGVRQIITATSPNAVWGARIMNVTPLQANLPRGEVQLYGKGFTKTIAAGNEWGTVGSGGPGLIEITEITPSGLSVPSNESSLTSANGFSPGAVAELLSGTTQYFYAIQWTRADDNSIQTSLVRGSAPFYVGDSAHFSQAFINDTVPDYSVDSSYFTAAAPSGQDRVGDTILCRSGRVLIPGTNTIMDFPGGVLGIHGWVRVPTLANYGSVVYQPMDYRFTDGAYGSTRITGFYSNTILRIGASTSVGQPLGEILVYAMESCGVESSHYDFSNVSAITVRGHRLAGIVQAKSFLEALQKIYLFSFYRDGGKLVASPYGEISTRSADNLINKFLRVDGQSAPYSQIILDPEKFPSTLQLSYLSDDLNLRSSSQMARRYPGYAYKGLFDGSLPAVPIQELNILEVKSDSALTNTEALTLTNQMFSIILGRRRSYEWIWPLDMIGVRLNEVVPLTLPYSGFTEPVIIESIDLAKNNSLVIKGSSFDNAYRNLVINADPSVNNLVSSTSPTSINFVLMDIPEWRTEAAGNLLYIAGYAQSWAGAVVFASIDQGANFQEAGRLSIESTAGTVTQQLEPVSHELVDYRSVVRVKIHDGAANNFVSINDLNFADNISNLLAVGGEIVKFKTATLIGPGEYELKIFRRGLFGTWPKITTHLQGEEAVLLDSSVVSIPYATDQINSVVLLRVVPSGQSASNASNTTLIPRGNALKPAPVANIRSVTKPSGDISISWSRVARGINNWVDYLDVPLIEVSEKYSIDILNSTSNYKRTISTTVPALEYPAIARNFDISGDQTFIVEIYQISDVVGRGFVSRGTITV
jgi:hypothetical protein